MEHQYCIILAGGVGSRLWPESRQRRPKQFIDFLHTGSTLLQATYARYARFIPQENILVVSNQLYADTVRAQLPAIPPGNLLLETMRRNTLPSVIWATMVALHRDSEADIVVTPVDHLIDNEAAYEADILKGLAYVASHGNALTIGVPPTRPETSYGYIQMGSQMEEDVFRVKSFTEKPDASFARLFVENGEFLWNTGLFLWHAASLVNRLRQNDAASQMLAQAAKASERQGDLQHLVAQLFSMSPCVSIETGLLEKVDKVDVLRGHFGWADLGTWNALYGASPKNERRNVATSPNTLLYDSEGCLVRVPEGKIVVVQGLKDYMVVDDGDILVICPRDDQKSLRRVMNDVQMNKGDKYV